MMATSTMPQSYSPVFVPWAGGMRYLRHVSLSINPEKIARDVIVVGASAGGIHAVIEAHHPPFVDRFTLIPAVHCSCASLGSNSAESFSRSSAKRVRVMEGKPLGS
jgi:hypothetical protein